ncbi:MAG TPA: nitroreductase [Saprospiraceae bacterium]|nr:nitroreductase [Saprospiraceae bacterium]
MLEFEQLSALIKKRRSIFPNSYTDQSIPNDTIMSILENANWAPSHKNTEPWRYKIIEGSALVVLGESLANIHKERNPGETFSSVKYNKLLTNPTKAAAIIAICYHKIPKSGLAEWEEIAAIGASVQNMWLSCTALGIGAFWSSPEEVSGLHNFLKLNEFESCLGLFYMGYPKIAWPEGSKQDIHKKIEWI